MINCFFHYSPLKIKTTIVMRTVNWRPHCLKPGEKPRSQCPFLGRNPTSQALRRLGQARGGQLLKQTWSPCANSSHAGSLPLLISTAVTGLQSHSLFTAFPEPVCFWWKQSLMQLYCTISAGVYHLKGTILIPTFALQYEP